MKQELAAFEQGLTKLWRKALQAHENGRYDPCAWANSSDLEYLEDIGVRANEIYDFVEDYADEGVPTLESFLKVHRIRHDYYMSVQSGKRSVRVVEPGELPERDAEAGGLPWLPRILVKARAKLRGELDPDIMFGCGGDRAFLDRHGFSAEEFLMVVRDYENHDAAIIEWVRQHSRS